MSAKLLMGLSEEKKDLEKQIGCMTGIFQVFDRHHLLTGRRINKRLPAGLPRSSRTTYKEECNTGSPQIVLEYGPNKSSKHNQRVSVESSRINTSNTELKSMHNDFGDVMKNFINGETRITAVKTSAVKEEVKKENVLKLKDSPRPIMSVDLNDSLRVLVRLKESTWNVSEAPRFSYDGREISRSRSSTKLRELPRLSLDSKSSSFDPKTKEMDRGSLSPRTPSVVAKLMGLEDLPASESPICADGEHDHPIHSMPISRHTETVYSQIETRIHEHDFSKSSKDLRALKHVLERIQAKALSDVQQPKPNSNLKPKALESPIVIMKPAKSIKRSKDLEGLSGLRKLHAKDSANRKKANDCAPFSENSSPKIKVPHLLGLPRPQNVVRERSGSPAKKLSSSGPMVKQRDVQQEKKPQTTRRENANRKPLKPSRAQTVAQQGKRAIAIPQREDKNISLAIHVDAEAMEDDRRMTMDSLPYHQDNQKIQSEDHSSTDSMLNLSEHPSPISVLEASFYQDDLPLSPVKRISRAIEGDEIETSSMSLNTTPSRLSSEIHSQKVGTITNLVEKLMQIGSAVETNTLEPDHDHVSQILMAAGLLPKSNIDELHEDLILDVVKDILAQKMEFLSHGYQPYKRTRHNLLAELCSGIKQVLVGRPKSASLADEEDVKLHYDSMRQSNGWQEFGVEVPGLVLEIERSIFKDLIDEIVIGEACSDLLAKGRRRKQMFFNSQN